MSLKNLYQVLFTLLAGVHGVCAAMEIDITEVAPGVFVHSGAREDANPANRGDIANIGFIIGEQSVAVIDAGGTAEVGDALLRAIRDRTDLPVSHLVLTHVHPDHLFGSSAFADEGPEVVGHRRLESALTQRLEYYTRRVEEMFGETSRPLFPTIEVIDSIEIDLGNRVLTIRAHPTAHTDHDITVFDHRTATFWLSDLLFVDRVPSLDGSVNGWLDVMDRLASIPAARVVPGHGPASADWPAAAADQVRYLRRLREDVRAEIRARASISDAVARVARDESGRWKLFDEYHPRNVTRAFTELEWE